MDELLTQFEIVKTEYEKFSTLGNKAAGTRARVALQKVKSLAQDVRKEILAKQKA